MLWNLLQAKLCQRCCHLAYVFYDIRIWYWVGRQWSE